MADPWDDWETAADAGLDPKPAKKVNEHEKNKQIWQDANAYAQPEIIRTDTTRTEYAPQLRILRRPKEPGSTTITHPSLLSDGADSTPKTLEEREANYNAARQKIFGANQQEKIVSKSEIGVDPESTTKASAGAAKRGDKAEDNKIREKKKLFDPGATDNNNRNDNQTNKDIKNEYTIVGSGRNYNRSPASPPSLTQSPNYVIHRKMLDSSLKNKEGEQPPKILLKRLSPPSSMSSAKSGDDTTHQSPNIVNVSKEEGIL
ncbi:7774_t:CDS:2 [Ambispora gerdemannii]|uniref:7774_t:CDS:1 n=1 Tax=Ambispora gerdemannii TaxID=144530 RepID=A0A9N8V128_9GLOM|nr:7774_t:CDS:2 [Ambispora gerdemannii]